MLNTIRDMGQSLFVKVIFGAIILTFIFWGVSAGRSGSRNDIATVNGESISFRDFQKEMDSVKRRSPQIFEQLRNNTVSQEQLKREVLQRLISNELLRQEANRLGILVTPQELYMKITTMDAFKGTDGNFDKNRYQQVVGSLGVSPGEFEAQQLDELLRSKLLGYMTSTVEVSRDEARAYFDFYREERKADYVLFPFSDYTSKVTVSDQEIAAYYEKNKNTYHQPARISLEHMLLTPETLAASYPVTDEEISTTYESEKQQKYTEAAQVKERHIIMAAPADGPEREKIKNRLEAVRKEIVAGEDFTKKSAQLSEDKNSSGDIANAEWIAVDQLVPVLTSALDKLKAGEMSTVIELPGAFVLFKVEDRKEEQIKPLKEVKEAIRFDLASKKVLANEKEIELKAENFLREGKSISEMAKEFNVTLLKTGLVPLENITANLGLLQSADDTLRVVSPGKMVPMPLSVKDGIVIVHVLENIPEGVPSLETLKDTVKQAVIKTKASELAKEDAEKALAYVKANDGKLPTNLLGQQKKSERTLRASPNNKLVIEPLGEASTLVHNLFMNAKGEWLPHSYEVKDGVVIAKVSDIKTGTDEEWNMYQKGYADGLLIRRSELAESAFIRSLFVRGKVTQNAELINHFPVF